ncbi:MAG: FG-GAP-like repeat-containing protein [Candidatus Dormibacteria bacterium]
MIRRAASRRPTAWLLAALALSLCASPTVLAGDASPPATALVLDGVSLSVSGSVVSEIGSFDAAPAGSAVQSASATRPSPYLDVTVSAIPFGTSDPDEAGIGTAEPGGAPGARLALQGFRNSQGAVELGSVDAQIFGASVAGAANLVSLQLDGAQKVPTVVVEWVAQAGPRLWLVRASAQVSTTPLTAAADQAMSGFSDLVVSASVADLAAPTTIGVDPTQGQDTATPITSGVGIVVGGEPTVPFPSWWSGDCDTNNYSAASLQLTGQAIAAYPLSSTADWNGLEACGPRPAYGEGPDVWVDFPGAHWSQLEFECVELSMRWMYLAWGVDPYPANGSGVVWNYSTFQSSYNPGGPDLVAVANDGSGALPRPGDVISYGSTSEEGHTAVVAAVNVNSSGNGTITTLEQNASSTGWDSVSVNDWTLGGFDGGVSGWLDDPGWDPNYVPALSSAQFIVGDFTGNGRDDLGAIAAGSSWIMPSTGSGLGTPGLWSTHDTYGDRATLVGDVTGDGKADLIAVGDSSTWVFTSTGTGFAPPVEWSDVPFYGTTATLLADLTGNGRDDLVAVDASAVWVMLSTGTGFAAPVEWSTQSFSGTQATLVGDVDGSGKDSLIAVDATGTWVMTANGSGFNAPVEWSSTPFYGTQMTLAGDLTGNGRTDLIAINSGSVSVMLSTGTGFGRPVTWVNIPFYGASATLVGDVSGQGYDALIAVGGSTAWVMQSTGSGFDRPVPWNLS